jgi:flagellar motor switch protein FliN/FliY
MLVMTLDFAKEMVSTVKKQYMEASQRPQQTQPDTGKPEETASKVNVQKVELQTFGDESKAPAMNGNRYDILMDVPLEVSIEIGRVKMPISEILKFTSGTIIELDKLVGEDVNIVINNRTIGKGEVVVIDEYYGMRISEILDQNSI